MRVVVNMEMPDVLNAIRDGYDELLDEIRRLETQKHHLENVINDIKDALSVGYLLNPDCVDALLAGKLPWWRGENS